MAIGPFDWWNRNAYLEVEQGDVKIYRSEGEQYLFIDQTLYASSTERPWYVTNVYPRAKGKCLEIGLGLGVASKVILANKAVTHLLTVEKNEDVISAFGRPLFKHNILNADIKEWLESFPALEPMYDFIFVDHYTFEEEEIEVLDALAEALKYLLKPGGQMVFWIDANAPEEDQEKIRKLWVVS